MGERIHRSDGARLLPPGEQDKWQQRLQHAMTGFVDAPHAAVREADQVVEEASARLTELLAERRRNLRLAWSPGPDEQPEAGDATPGATADTEQLRLALRDYRELAERLLDV